LTLDVGVAQGLLHSARHCQLMITTTMQMQVLLEKRRLLLRSRKEK